MKIENSIALVTGGSRGIGRELVEALLHAGARRVYAASRKPGPTPADPRIVPLQLDVTDQASIAAAAERAADVNLLINNAGIVDFGSILEVSDAVLARNMAVNYSGKLQMARAYAPIIQHNGGGAIVNILTVLALASMPGIAAYNASKAAAWSMALSLRASLADAGIAVHNVFPGPVDTDMLAGVEMDKTPPADVARAVVQGLIAGEEDIFPDPMSRSVYPAWKADHKAVEAQFAGM